MNKKVILSLLCSVGAFFVACSDDSPAPSSANPVVSIDDGTSSAAGLPADGIADGTNTAGGENQNTPTVIDPVTGLPVPASSAAQNAQGITDANGNALPGSSASSANGEPAQSSSAGLKDYEDNHAAKESFLPAAGFYSNLTINPPTPQKGGEIKCTFDGSFPTANSEGLTSAKQITQNTVIRCSEFVNGQAADTTTQTYFINETVNMPVVALTVNHHDMFDSTDGLYATGDLTSNNNNQGGMFGNIGGWGVGGDDTNNPKCNEPCKQANFWREDELPVHVEFFENGSSTAKKNWEIDAGISIIGNYSRYKPKKSVSIKMDNDEYGDKVLKYSLFKTRPEAKKIKSFNLRNNGNRFWTDYIGDPMLVSLMEGTEVDYQRSRQVVVFYNGEYFGIHDMRERLNRSYVETNYGIDSKSINVVKSCYEGSDCNNGWAPSGTTGASADEFIQVVNSVTNGNFEGENNQSYAQIKEKLNVSSFAQYMMAEMYIHNGDWPGNNVRAWGGNGNPFKFIIFDVDHGYGFSPGISNFDTENQNMFQWVLGSTTMSGSNSNQGGMFGGMGWGMGGASSTIGQMLLKLLKNPDFQRLFINQSCILLNDYLTYNKVDAAINNMMGTIPSSEQSRDEQRWPRNQEKYNWAPNGSDIRRFAQNRTETVRQEMATYFGLSGEAEVTISTSGNGAVLVDEMKLPSTNYKGKFFQGNKLQLTAVAQNGGVFTGWSDGSTENPHLVEPVSGMTITAQFK